MRLSDRSRLEDKGQGASREKGSVVARWLSIIRESALNRISASSPVTEGGCY